MASPLARNTAMFSAGLRVVSFHLVLLKTSPCPQVGGQLSACDHDR
jgi:hypothetical protein